MRPKPPLTTSGLFRIIPISGTVNTRLTPFLPVPVHLRSILSLISCPYLFVFKVAVSFMNMAFLGDITGDFKEIRENWNNRSLGYRGLVILSIFFTTSSLTGLAGLVIQWRGFIKDGINFYHEWIVGPLRSVFGWISLDVSESQVNLFTLSSLIGIPLIWKGIFIFKEANKEGGNKSPLAKILAIIGLFAFLAMITNPLFVEDNFGYTFGLGLGYIFYFYMSLKNGNYDMISILIRPLFAVLIVLILAAINKGLQAPI